MCILRILNHTKGIQMFPPPSKRFFISKDVTFNEKESYFQPHLQGESVREEDESLMLSNIAFGPEIGTETERGIKPTPELAAGPEQTPQPIAGTEQVPKPTAEPAPNDGGKFGKNLVYSRREKAIPKSIHVQESNPLLQEVITSNPINSNNSNEFVLNNSEAQVDQNLDLPIALRKGTRTCTKQPLYPLSNFLSFENFPPTHKTFLTNLNSTPTPSTVSEALFNRKWKQAMDVEIEALNKNNTWELVTLPTGKKPVGCKWVYTIKYRADGTIERYKARLVAKGFTQTYGVDYLETFAPVAKMNTIRVILSLAANHDWDLQQFDVKNAFLHGELEEEIYMDLPPGYDGQVAVGTVCKLKKALYGLKQSPRAWFGRFTKVMTNLGYKQSQGDHTLFIKHSVSGGVTILWPIPRKEFSYLNKNILLIYLKKQGRQPANQ